MQMFMYVGRIVSFALCRKLLDLKHRIVFYSADLCFDSISMDIVPIARWYHP